MTPSKLFKLNLKHYKLLLLTVILSLCLGLAITKNFSIKTINKYKIVIVEDMNTKYLIDKIYSRDNTNQYSKYLKNYIVSEFINSSSGKNSSMGIDREGSYSITREFDQLSENEIESFENSLTEFLKKSENYINNEIKKNFGTNIDVNSRLFFKRYSNKKGSEPFTIYFVTIIIGIILFNFIIILENPPKK